MEKDKAKRKTTSKEGGDETERRDGIDVELEMRRLEQEVMTEGKREGSRTPAQQQLSGSEISKEIRSPFGKEPLELPEWVKYPWMYARPSKPEFLESWFRDWGDLILKWCQFNVKHIISLNDFKASRPLDKLPEKEVRDLLQYIVDRGLGKWFDKDKTAVRVMWRSLEEWANDVYEWALDNGVEILDMFLIRSAKTDFCSLPISDIRNIMEIMVKNKMMKWMDKKHEQAKLIYQ